jgi:hypothetical protein
LLLLLLFLLSLLLFLLFWWPTLWPSFNKKDIKFKKALLYFYITMLYFGESNTEHNEQY